MKIFVQLSIILFVCCGLTLVGALLVGRRSNGLSVGYQLDGYPCAIQLIDTDRPSDSYALVSKEPFCLHYSAWSPNHQYAALAAYPNGSLGIATGRNGSEWQGIVDIDGVVATQGSLVWSSDSQQLAFLTDSTDVMLLATVQMANGLPRKPRFFTINATEPIPYSPPVWSPDGKFIAFAAYDAPRRQGSEELYILNVSSGEVRRLTNNHYRDDSPSWSPDGTQLVFTSSETGYNELHIMNVATLERRQLTYSTVGYIPSWSPDGNRILFMSNMDHGTDLYMIGTNGMGLRRLTNNHYTGSIYPIWLFPE